MNGNGTNRARRADSKSGRSWGAVHPRGPKPAARRAYLLLEVILALGLLVVGLATIGMQIQRSWDTAVDGHRQLRAMHLAQSTLDEIDAGLIIDVDSAVEKDLEKEFGRLFPRFGWRLRIEPTQTADLWLLRLQILYQERRDVEAEEFNFEEAEVVYTLRALRATPATINPQRDFGADDETMAQLTEALVGTELDAQNLDFRKLAGLPLEDLIALVDNFRQAGLLDDLDLRTLLPPAVLDLLREAGLEEFTTNGTVGGATEETPPQ